LILKCLKNRPFGWFFKNSKNRATLVFEFRTLNEEEEEEDGTKEIIMIGGLRRFKPPFILIVGSIGTQKISHLGTSNYVCQ